MSLIHYTSCPVCASIHIRDIFAVKDYTVSGEAFPIWQCDSCGLRFTQDVPDMADIGRYYQSENYISHSDTKKGLINQLYHLARKRTLQKKYKWVSQFSGLSGGTLLDAGCGTGAFLHTMQQHGWNVTGIEPDEGARQKAKELYHLDVLPATNLYSLPPDSFDAITLWHVLEHVHTLQDYIRQLKILLKPGGILLIAVPNYTSADEKIYRQYWAAYDVPRHLYHFSPSSMGKLLSLHGLNIMQTEPMLFDPFYICLVSEKYKTGRNNFVAGFVNGFRCYIASLSRTTSCSSLLYVIKK